MKGPFFCERMLLTLPLHDELISPFVVPSFVSEGRLSPRRHGVIALHTTFTTAVRMIYRIHHDTAIRRADSHMPGPADFTDGHILVVEISDLPNCCNTVDIHQPNFTGRQLHMGIRALFRNKLRCSTCAARHLRAASRTEFDIVNSRTERDVF